MEPYAQPIINSLSREPNRKPEASTMIIFGASGDLTHRKLIPALYDLHSKDRLPEGFSVVGFSRTPFSHEHYRVHLREAVQDFCRVNPSELEWERFAQRIYYCEGDLMNPDDYKSLEDLLHHLERERVGTGNRAYYLALAPQFYHP